MADILKAPGTPMMRPSSAANSLAKLTVFAGEPSVRTSRLGTLSPTLTRAAGVAWKALVVLAVEAMPERAARVMGRRDALNAIVHSCSGGQVDVFFVCLFVCLVRDGWIRRHKAEER